MVARSAEEARKKKKRGGDEIVAVRTPSEADMKDIRAGRWVRTRSSGQRVTGRAPGNRRGQGPKPKNYRKRKKK